MIHIPAFRPNDNAALRPARARGVVLVIVLVVIVVLALAAYSFCQLMINERRAVKATGRQLQAREFLNSGVEYLRQALSGEATVTAAAELYDNPTLFHRVPVVDSQDPNDAGGFTIVAPAVGENGELAGVRFGVEDDSARLNLQLLKAIADTQDEAGVQMLMALPGMSPDVAEAILDWLDEDDDARPNGAESDYYASLRPAYAAANRSPTSVEDLLLVRGVTRELLFGRDLNRNYLLEPSETQEASPTVVFDESNPFGWASYLTLYSRSRPRPVEENGIQGPGIDLNQDDMQKLYDELNVRHGKAWAMFIVAYRQNGPYDGESWLDNALTRDLDFSQPGTFMINDVLDLVGASVSVTLAGDMQPVVLLSPIKDDPASLEYDLPQLQTHFVIDDSQQIQAGVNIMAAPPVVMKAIPRIDPAAAEAIIAHRQIVGASQAGEPLDALWPLNEGIVTLEEMRKILPFINLGGTVFRAQVIGHFHDGQVSKRAEVVIDTTSNPPRLLNCRDLSHFDSSGARAQLAVVPPTAGPF